jgi:hypothetical protein
MLRATTSTGVAVENERVALRADKTFAGIVYVSIVGSVA